MEEDGRHGGVRLARGVLRTGAVLHPGRPGAVKLARKYGEKLLCVRYRYDKERGVRLVTVELVEEVVPWVPRPPREESPSEFVYIEVAREEVEVRALVRGAKGFWDSEKKLWRLRRERVVALKLVDRIVPGKEGGKK